MVTKAEITLIKSLADRRARTESGLFIAEGAKLVSELPGAGMRVRKVFTNGDFRLPGVECEHAAPKEMERLSHLKTPSDVVALVEIPTWKFDPRAVGRTLSLALDGVQDPGNLGTILRIADWFGIREVLCSPACADCFNPKVVQATMGAIARVKVHYGDLEAMLAAIDAPVCGTFLDGENIYGAQLPAAGVIVLGSEGRGVSPDVERLVTRRLFIPSYPAGQPTSESLNVAAAAAIVCSEFRRRG